MSNKRVAVVTDSTAGIPPQLAQRMGIKIVQMQLRIGDEVHEEARVPNSDVIATMQSQTTPVSTMPAHEGALYWAYQDAVAAGMDAVVAIHTSSKLSKTYEIALDTAEQMRIPVHVMDSASCGMSIGYAVLAAAEAANAGANARQVVTAAHRRLTTSTQMIYVDSLEYLRRAGRIGAAAALVGTALSLKPVLTVADGQVTPLDRGFGTARALRKMLDTAVTLAGDQMVDIGVEHFGAPEAAASLLERLRRRVPKYRNCLLTEVSSIVGVNTGPGSLGIAVSPV